MIGGEKERFDGKTQSKPMKENVVLCNFIDDEGCYYNHNW